MQRTNGGKRISRMIKSGELTDATLFTFVRAGVNYAITYGDLVEDLTERVLSQATLTVYDSEGNPFAIPLVPQ